MVRVEEQTDFTQQLDDCQSKLRSYLRCLVSNRQDAEDLYQQTVLILWRKYSQFDSDRSFFSWACGIARFEVANFLRSSSSRKRLLSEVVDRLMVQSFENMPTQEEQLRQDSLEECLNKLNVADRQLMHQFYFEAESIASIARKWNRSTQSVHNSLKRIRSLLFQCIERSVQIYQGKWASNEK